MGLFVLNTHFKIDSIPSAPLAPSSALADGIGSLWSCALLSLTPLGFPYANKDWYLPSHLTWLGETSVRTILEQLSPKWQRDFRLKSQAGCSEYVTQVARKQRAKPEFTSEYAGFPCPQ